MRPPRRLAIPDVPLSFGRLVPPLQSFEIAVHFAHRVCDRVAGRCVCLPALLRRHSARPELVARRAWGGPVVLQILLGATTVLTRLAVLPATAHVVVRSPSSRHLRRADVRSRASRGTAPPGGAPDRGRRDAPFRSPTPAPREARHERVVRAARLSPAFGARSAAAVFWS